MFIKSNIRPGHFLALTLLTAASVLATVATPAYAQGYGFLTGATALSQLHLALCGDSLCQDDDDTVASCPADCALGDHFDTSDTLGWIWGTSTVIPESPQVMSDGGPLGVGDGYLRVGSHGTAGAGSRLAVFNETQWTGDFLLAQQDTIYADVRNFGPTILELRIWAEGDGGDAFSDAVSLEAGSQWQTISWDISADAMHGTDVVNVLNSVNRMRIFHNTLPEQPPETILALIGLDNISNIFPDITCGTRVVGSQSYCDELLPNDGASVAPDGGGGDHIIVLTGDIDTEATDAVPPNGCGCRVTPTFSAVLLFFPLAIASTRRRFRK